MAPSIIDGSPHAASHSGPYFIQLCSGGYGFWSRGMPSSPSTPLGPKGKTWGKCGNGEGGGSNECGSAGEAVIFDTLISKCAGDSCHYDQYPSGTLRRDLSLSSMVPRDGPRCTGVRQVWGSYCYPGLGGIDRPYCTEGVYAHVGGSQTDSHSANPYPTPHLPDTHTHPPSFPSPQSATDVADGQGSPRLVAARLSTPMAGEGQIC